MRFSTFVAGAVVSWAMSLTTTLAADVETLSGDKAENRDIARECLNDLKAFDEKLARTGFGVSPPGGAAAATRSGYYVVGVQTTPRQKMRSLRDAAYIYAMDGNEQSCQTVVASMQQVYEEYLRLLRPDAENPNVRKAWRETHLSRAKPILQMDHLMRADVLVGSDIRNLEDEKLGEIEDLVVDSETKTIQYVLATRGGFLDLGQKLIAIPWNDLRSTDDHELYVLNVSAKAFEEAPKVGRQNFEQMADPDWQSSLSAYWDRVTVP